MKKEIKDFFDKLELGRFKLWIGRVQGYLGIMSFSLILYGMAIKNNLFGWSWEVWVTLMIIGVPLILWFDIKIVCPSELKYGFGLHPKFKEILEKNDLILDKLKKLEKENKTFYKFLNLANEHWDNYIKDKGQSKE